MKNPHAVALSRLMVGKRRQFTPEQLEAAKVRLAKAREKKKELSSSRSAEIYSGLGISEPKPFKGGVTP